jgi:tetratricopeptide (TPR) repeat protein
MSDPSNVDIDSLRLAVAAAHKQGDLQRARAACAELLEAAPHDGDAHMWLGLVTMAERRWREAIAPFERALEKRVDPWSLVNLAACHEKLGQLAEAEYCFRGATTVRPDLTRAHVGLATVLHGMRRFDEALAQLDVAEARDAADYHIDLRRGCTLAELGRYDEAQLAFQRSVAATPQFIYPRLVAFDRGTYDSVSLAPPHSVPRTVHPYSSAGLTGIVLVSCDAPYARKYAFPFIRSYAVRQQSGYLLHVHLYDPDPHIVAEVKKVAGEAGVTRLRITTEKSPYEAQRAQQRKAYYACGRLAHLSHWLDEYGVPTLCLDADFIVEESLDPFFAVLHGKDLVLHPRHTIDSPWLDIVANVIGASPTPAARRYLSAVASYALASIEREPQAWLADQAALYCVLRMFQRYDVPPAIAWFERAEERGLWHIGHAYDFLLSDPRFTRYAGPA